VKLNIEDFSGAWRIQRDISDLRILETGTLEGQATFTPDADGLRYHETGQLRFAGSAPVLAERRYIWTFQADIITVTHADGSPFHSFERSAGFTATPHLCGQDLYQGTYSFTQFPDWQVTWQVTGPRKDYRSVTSYSRA